MLSSNFNNDNDSIDFDFFDNEGNTVKTYLNSSINKNDCRKIVTKAVIENNSKYTDAPDQSEQIADINLNPSRIFEFDVDSHDNIYKQGVNTRPGESFVYDNPVGLIKQDSLSILLDDINDITYDSTSDSTITTISSDFTSVSSFSIVSDSSLESDDVSLDSSTGQNENTGLNELLNFTYASTIKKNNDTGKIESYESQFNKELMKFETNIDQGLNYTISVKSDIINKCTTNNKTDCKYNELKYYDGITKNGSYKHNRPIITESIICATEEEFKNLSFSPQSSSTRFSMSTPSMRESSKLQLKKRKFNLTFNREELIKIERDNLTLLKKIMANSKPRTIMCNNNTFSHKKASAAINRAKLQKKIEQENYILYSKINAMGRMKNVY